MRRSATIVGTETAAGREAPAPEIIAGIRVEIEESKSGLWYGTSPDVRGLLVAEQSAEAVRLAIPTAIRELQEATPSPGRLIVRPA